MQLKLIVAYYIDEYQAKSIFSFVHFIFISF